MGNLYLEPTIDDISNAEEFWIKNAQKNLIAEFKAGKFARLAPIVSDVNILLVGSRIENWSSISYDHKPLPLLPFGHRLSRLYVEKMHNNIHGTYRSV